MGDHVVRVSARETFAAQTLRVEITGIGGFRFRLWLVIQMLRLAGFIAPVNVILSVDYEARA